MLQEDLHQCLLISCSNHGAQDYLGFCVVVDQLTDHIHWGSSTSSCCGFQIILDCFCHNLLVGVVWVCVHNNMGGFADRLG